MRLGKTGIEAFPLGFGSMRLPMVRIGSGPYVDMDRAIETIRHALDRGINYIDTAFMYCTAESEIAVGRAIRGQREKVTLTTKASQTRMSRPGDLRRMLEHQLRKLETDYLDFYCFHGIGWQNFHDIDRQTDWIKDMTRARDEGMVRHIAFSFHDEPESLIKLIDLGLFEMVTCQYNYLDRKNEPGIAHAHEKGVAVVIMGTVGGGRLAELPAFLQRESRLDTSSAAGLAIRFVLSNPGVSVALSGMRNPQMVDENIAAAQAGPLSQDEYRALDALLAKTRKLADLYCTGCGYCMPCKQGVDIPARFSAMNAFKVYGMKEQARETYAGIREREAKTEGGGICIQCGECEPKCPQKIEIVRQLEETEKVLGSKQAS